MDKEKARLFAPMAAGGAEAQILARELREVIAALPAERLAVCARLLVRPRLRSGEGRSLRGQRRME